jgi:hypothetical protein
MKNLWRLGLENEIPPEHQVMLNITPHVSVSTSSKWIKTRLYPFSTAATTGILYQPQMINDGDCGAIGGMEIGRGNWSTRRQFSTVPLLFTTNPRWPDPCLNPESCCGKPATNRLSYGTALISELKWYLTFRTNLSFLWRGFVNPMPNTQDGGLSLVSCQQLLIKYIRR